MYAGLYDRDRTKKTVLLLGIVTLFETPKRYCVVVITQQTHQFFLVVTTMDKHTGVYFAITLVRCLLESKLDLTTANIGMVALIKPYLIDYAGATKHVDELDSILQFADYIRLIMLFRITKKWVWY